MNVTNKYQNKKIAIYGMGKSGMSTAKKLQTLKAKVFCWDDKTTIRKKINFKLSKFWKEKDKNSIDYIVISPGIDIKKCKIRKYLNKNRKKLITDLDIFFEINKNPYVISITGTNGKSTTCRIIERILKKGKYNVKVGGNIGFPVLSLKNDKKNSIFVLEISSYQLEYSKLFKSKHAAILNISPDHLERHKSINNYLKIKSKIFLKQEKNDFSYINYSNKYSKNLKSIISKKNIKSKIVQINKFFFNPLLKRITNKYFKNKGNIENFLFAYNIAKKLKISDKTILSAINSFKGLPHRQELIFSNRKVSYINDSKSTSFDASLQSLSSYNNIYWIVGGLPKYKDKLNLNGVNGRIIKAYIIGKNTEFFISKLINKIPFKVSKNLKRAIKDIISDIKKNKKTEYTILFSPAAASFDQFENFEQRGILFKKLIGKNLII